MSNPEDVTPEPKNRASSEAAERDIIFANIGDGVHGAIIGKDITVVNPPKAILKAPTRIPASRTPNGLVGRADELAWLRQRLTGPGSAALAGVRGIGGIGKTELAIAIARELESSFASGVIWLECGPRSVTGVQDLLAGHLRMELDSNGVQLRADQLAHALDQHPPHLIVLDDVRQAHQGALALLYPPNTGCALLLTSRRRNVLAAAARNLLAQVAGADEVAQEPEAASAIVDLLEQIPLALILAGNHVQKLQRRRRPPADPLAATLRDLTDRRDRVLHRDEQQHLSMRITFDLSYDELDEADQRALAALGVFARNEFALWALQFVWGQEENGARQTAQTLENAGLIEEVDDDLWWMHDVLRDEAGARPTDAHAARGHAAWIERLLNALELRNLDSWRFLTTMRPEIDQAGLWLAQAWRAEPALAADLAIEFGNLHTDYSDQRLGWLRLGIQAADVAEAARNRAILQGQLAGLLRTRGQYDEAEGLYRSGLQINYQIRDLQGIAVYQMRLGVLLIQRGQKEEGLALLHEARAGFTAIGLTNWVAQVDERLAQLSAAADPPDDPADTIVELTQEALAAPPIQRQAWRENVAFALDDAQSQREEAKAEFFTHILALLDGRVDGSAASLPVDHPYAAALARIVAGASTKDS